MIFTLRGVHRGECGRTGTLTLVHRRRSRIGDHRSSLLNRTQILYPRFANDATEQFILAPEGYCQYLDAQCGLLPVASSLPQGAEHKDCKEDATANSPHCASKY